MLAELTADGLELFDLEDDVGAFTVALPRVRVIPIERFDPWTLLSSGLSAGARCGRRAAAAMAPAGARLSPRDRARAAPPSARSVATQQPPATATTGAKLATVSSTGIPPMWAMTVMSVETAAAPRNWSLRRRPPRSLGSRRRSPGARRRAACEAAA